MINKIPLENKAIVIGGGIAGLLAARVLCNHFDHVILIERDSYPDDIGPRNGTPQSNHIHVLLMRGKQILIELFPGLERSLLTKGAHKIDLIADARYHLATGWALTFDSKMTTLTCTRQLLEYAIRKEVISNFSSVNILENTKVTGLSLAEDNDESKRKIVRGVKIVRGNTEAEAENMYAELIVDASGRNSKTPNWLEESGLGRPKETRINSYIGYSTRRFKLSRQMYSAASNDHRSKWKAMIIFTKPPENPRMGVIYPVEGNDWLVGLLGIGKHYPPVKEQEFLNFARELEVKEMYEAIKDADPIGPIYGYRELGSRQYHYEKMKTWPENFIALGDSISAFNPLYGQGITVTAIGAVMLDEYLYDFRKANKMKKNLIGFANKFQKRIAKVNSFPWLLGTSEDFRWSTTEGNTPNLYVRFMQKYSYHVMLLATDSEIATRSFFEMIHMLKSPLILFHPKIVLQIIWKIFKDRGNH